jgi:hypothetical protein
METSLSRRQGSRGAWVHLGNINYTARVHNIMYSWYQYLQEVNTELVYFGILKKSIEEKKGDNIEKYAEKNYT